MRKKVQEFEKQKLHLIKRNKQKIKEKVKGKKLVKSNKAKNQRNKRTGGHVCRALSPDLRGEWDRAILLGASAPVSARAPEGTSTWARSILRS